MLFGGFFLFFISTSREYVRCILDQKRRFRRDLIGLHNALKGGFRQLWAYLSWVTSDPTRGNGLRPWQGRIR